VNLKSKPRDSINRNQNGKMTTRVYGSEHGISELYLAMRFEQINGWSDQV